MNKYDKKRYQNYTIEQMQNHRAIRIINVTDSNFSGCGIRKHPGRFLVLCLFFAAFLVLSLITRTVLLLKCLREVDPKMLLLLKIYAMGLFFDVVTFGYVALPFVLYLIFLPDRLYRSRLHQPVMYIAVFLTTYLFLFSSVAEYFFFDEFGVRFNFIAVDYLVYTTEVVRNIRESYPMPVLLSAIFALSSLLFIPVWRFVASAQYADTPFLQRIKQGAVFLLLPVLSLLFVNQSISRISSNMYANELAANGIYNRQRSTGLQARSI